MVGRGSARATLRRGIIGSAGASLIPSRLLLRVQRRVEIQFALRDDFQLRKNFAQRFRNIFCAARDDDGHRIGREMIFRKRADFIDAHRLNPLDAIRECVERQTVQCEIGDAGDVAVVGFQFARKISREHRLSRGEIILSDRLRETNSELSEARQELAAAQAIQPFAEDT